MRLKINQNKCFFSNLTAFGLPILFLVLAGCLGIERVTCKEMEVAKWHFDHEEYGEALPTIQKFADHDDPDAQYMLGYMYFYGHGIEVNRIKAKYYFDESGKKGYPPALMAKHVIAEKQAERNISILRPINLTEDNQVNMKPQFSVVKNSFSKINDISNKKTKSKKNIQLDDKKILLVSSRIFTIQMLALANLDELKKVISKYELYDGYYLYQTIRNDKPWYVLINGSYKKVSSARKSIEQLPKVMKKWKPFVNKFSEVHRQVSLATS